MEEDDTGKYYQELLLESLIKEIASIIIEENGELSNEMQSEALEDNTKVIIIL